MTADDALHEVTLVVGGAVSAALILREFPETHRGVAMGYWSAAGEAPTA